MLATAKQITYLQHLTDRTEYIKQRHPSLIPLGFYHTTWDGRLTSARASMLIDCYQSILTRANAALYHNNNLTKDDLPE